jgi:serine phosphatase RsbU (regulator of sigma subunit)
MSNNIVIGEQSLNWAVAARASPGFDVSGDTHVVKAFDGGVLLGAVDGLGHGLGAMAAARLAADILQRHAHEPPARLVRRCHAELAGGRGVVLTVVSMDPLANRLAWVGVGNVEAVLVRADAGATPATESLVLRSGVVGYILPQLNPNVLAIVAGDLLVLATDGIAPGFVHGWAPTEPPQRIAQRILERNFKGTDDALVLVARYLGPSHE